MPPDDAPPFPAEDRAPDFHAAVFARLNGDEPRPARPAKRRRGALRRWRALARRRARGARRTLVAPLPGLDRVRRAVIGLPGRADRAAGAARARYRAARDIVSEMYRATHARLMRHGSRIASARERADALTSAAVRRARTAVTDVSRRSTAVAADRYGAARHALGESLATAGATAARGLARRADWRARAATTVAGTARSAARGARGMRDGAARAARAAGVRGFTVMRGALLPAAAASLGVALVFVAAFARSVVTRRATSAPVDRGVATARPPQEAGAVHDVSAVLRDGTAPEEKRVALVEEIARDAGDDATELLLVAAGSPSTVVSMAGLRALRGRPCARVAPALVQGLGHADWQRRAWAAKVIGENRCTAVAPELRRQLARERDARVRRQLAVALAARSAGATR